MKIVYKLWGQEWIICNNELYCAKILHLNPGYESSYHFHPQKDETFYIFEGQCHLNLNGTEQLFTSGDVVRIAPRTPHSFYTLGEESCRILEVSTPHSDSDVVRLRESRAL